jgi:UDP-N-acetyl-D-glucosamine dehydrogenase
MIGATFALSHSFMNNLSGRAQFNSVGIVGLGYVGLPLALRFAEAGFPVLGFDIDEAKIHAIEKGCSYIKHIGDEAVAAGRTQGLRATADFARVSEIDALIICVPTPLNAHREPDLRFVVGTVEAILPHIRRGQLISLESTTYPGTTEEELRPRIESRGFRVGEDVFLVFSPEREDPGNLQFSTQTIPKVVGGSTPACRDAGVGLYSKVIDKIVPVSSTQAAEMTKLLENIHRAVNIGLVNEMKIIADRMGIDIYEVIRAAATKPFGFVPYYPGPGLGGHCIPIDPFYLTWKAREYGVHTRFIELAGEINSDMPEWVMRKVNEALNERERSIKGCRL